MKYLEFKNIYNKFPYFYSSNLISLNEPLRSLRKQLNEWTKKGLIIQLKKGLYTLNDEDRMVPLNREIISNVLIEPSYVSLEYALSYYGFIPERVGQLTAVTPKKTQEFVNKTGVYSYRSIKNKAFLGFREEQTSSGFSFFIATKEKAIVDFLYFNVLTLPNFTKKIFEENYRLQNIEALDEGKLNEYASFFNNKKLEKLVSLLIAYINEKEYQLL